MKASEQKITTFLNTAKVQFIIPVYQRNYDWKIEQCAKLLNDILTIGQDKKQESQFYWQYCLYPQQYVHIITNSRMGSD
ncbi:DUF262 domain-containing protein [Kingella kingae]|nr:DUF262 domain-containing protein [Kingella kingae]MDK4574093.1 DUF262 domain-containing protein [Kingella kingae]MDK4606223.1 DUF262 domain-containing protein [Kingella kingae]